MWAWHWKIILVISMSQVTSDQIKQWAREIGFDLVGITRAKPIGYEQAYREYLDKKMYGEMGYLARNVEKRIDPSELVPGAKSIICTATNYYVGDEPVGQDKAKSYGRVARYAWGKDYHIVLKDRLKVLADKIRESGDGKIMTRRFVDTAPLMEREHAMQAGLGWIGKNGLLINKRLGSWLLLGEIVTDLELDYDQPGVDHCGTCRNCLDGCPTNAFVKPQVLDPRKCISYLTIESRSDIPNEYKQSCGDWIFGCDVCQEVCPFNRKSPSTEDEDFQPNEKWSSIDLHELEKLEEKEFTDRFVGNSMTRTNQEHMTHVGQNCLNNLSESKSEN